MFKWLDPWKVELGLANKSPNTVEAYIRATRDAGEVIGKPPLDWQRADLMAYQQQLVEKGMKAATVKLKMTAIREFCRWLAEVQGATELHHAVRNLPLPKVSNQVEASLTVGEIQRLLRHCEQQAAFGGKTQCRNSAIIHVMYYSLGRVSEIAAVKCADVDLDRGLLTLHRKGGDDEQLPMPNALRGALADWLKVRKLYSIESDFLFPHGHKDGRPITRHAINRMLGDMVSWLGLPHASSHTIRAAGATHMLENNTDPSVIAAYLGHSNTQTTRRYFRGSNKLKRMAADKLDFMAAETGPRIYTVKGMPPDSLAQMLDYADTIGMSFEELSETCYSASLECPVVIQIRVDGELVVSYMAGRIGQCKHERLTEAELGGARITITKHE